MDDLSFIDAATGWICAGEGRIYRTLDGRIYLYVLHAGDQHEMGKLVRVR